MSKRLDECPGVGPVLATALVATVADPKIFRSGRLMGLKVQRVESKRVDAFENMSDEELRQYVYVPADDARQHAPRKRRLQAQLGAPAAY
jgi:transposase